MRNPPRPRSAPVFSVAVTNPAGVDQLFNNAVQRANQNILPGQLEEPVITAEKPVVGLEGYLTFRYVTYSSVYQNDYFVVTIPDAFRFNSVPHANAKPSSPAGEVSLAVLNIEQRVVGLPGQLAVTLFGDSDSRNVTIERCFIDKSQSVESGIGQEIVFSLGPFHNRHYASTNYLNGTSISGYFHLGLYNSAGELVEGSTVPGPVLRPAPMVLAMSFWKEETHLLSSVLFKFTTANYLPQGGAIFVLLPQQYSVLHGGGMCFYTLTGGINTTGVLESSNGGVEASSDKTGAHFAVALRIPIPVTVPGGTVMKLNIFGLLNRSSIFGEIDRLPDMSSMLSTADWRCAGIAASECHEIIDSSVVQALPITKGQASQQYDSDDSHWLSWAAHLLYGAHADCKENRTWTQILAESASAPNKSERFMSGGLGNLAVKGEFQIWVCWHNHPCLKAIGGADGDRMCYVKNKVTEEWHAWGLNSKLGLCR